MITDARTPAINMVENWLAPALPPMPLPDLREDVGEHEHEQQWLQDRPRDELLEVVEQHVEVAQQQRLERGERADVRPVELDGVGGAVVDVVVVAVIRGGPSQ